MDGFAAAEEIEALKALYEEVDMRLSKCMQYIKTLEERIEQVAKEKKKAPVVEVAPPVTTESETRITIDTTNYADILERIGREFGMRTCNILDTAEEVDEDHVEDLGRELNDLLMCSLRDLIARKPTIFSEQALRYYTDARMRNLCSNHKMKTVADLLNVPRAATAALFRRKLQLYSIMHEYVQNRFRVSFG